MTHTAQPVRFYDQVLNEIEMGRVQQAVFLLAGTLDGAIAEGGNAKPWREQLLKHPLRDILDEGRGRESNTVSSQLSEIRTSIDHLGSSRALIARADLEAHAINQAGLAGKSTRQLDDIGIGSNKTDVIIATALPDRCSTQELGTTLLKLRGSLSACGTILISSLVPGHFGRGLQVIGLGYEANCHDEVSLGQAAEFAGFNLTHFRDASDCLVWGVLRIQKPDSHKGGE